MGRFVASLFVVSLLALSPFWGIVTADENGDIDNVPIELLADRILAGDGAESDALIERAATMEEAELKMLFRAVRNRHLAFQRLEKKRVSGAVLEEANLDQATTFLQTITGFKIHLSKKAREEKFEDVVIDLNLKDVSVRTFLNLITRPYELYWSMRGEVIDIVTREELAVRPKEEEPETLALRRRVKATKVSLSIQDLAFSDVVKTLAIQTGLNVLIDSRVQHDLGRQIVPRLKVSDTSLETVLNLLAECGGDSVVWVVVGNVIKLTHKDYLR